MRFRDHSNSHFNLVEGYLAATKKDTNWWFLLRPKQNDQNPKTTPRYTPKQRIKITNRPKKTLDNYIMILQILSTRNRQSLQSFDSRPPIRTDSDGFQSSTGLRPNVPGPVRMPGWRGWWGPYRPAKAPKLSAWRFSLYFHRISLRICQDKQEK